MSSGERQPLISHGRDREEEPKYNRFSWLLHNEQREYVHSSRAKLQRFLTSKTGHYFVILLVTADVISIIADFVVNIYMCKAHCAGKLDVFQRLDYAHFILEVLSLVFSCLFMAELLMSTWAFGFSYFRSWFHCLDAAVIITSFAIDASARGGLLEELGSIVVVLRLWRVFKIIEELSAGAEEQMDILSQRLEQLEKENQELRRRTAAVQDAH